MLPLVELKLIIKKEDSLTNNPVIIHTQTVCG